MNLIEGLTNEILRVTEIKKVYEELPKQAGAIVAAIMGEAIEAAKKAQAGGDIIECMRALEALKEFEL
jgi:hypothetical protein